MPEAENVAERFFLAYFSISLDQVYILIIDLFYFMILDSSNLSLSPLMFHLTNCEKL